MNDGVIFLHVCRVSVHIQDHGSYKITWTPLAFMVLHDLSAAGQRVSEKTTYSIVKCRKCLYPPICVKYKRANFLRLCLVLVQHFTIHHSEITLEIALEKVQSDELIKYYLFLPKMKWLYIILIWFQFKFWNILYY